VEKRKETQIGVTRRETKTEKIKGQELTYRFVSFDKYLGWGRKKDGEVPRGWTVEAAEEVDLAGTGPTQITSLNQNPLSRQAGKEGRGGKGRKAREQQDNDK